MYHFFENIFGLHLAEMDVDWYHFAARAFLVFFVGVILVRIQNTFVGVSTPFTELLNIALGSLLAGAIMSRHAFFPILGMVLLLSLANWALALLCLYVPIIDRIVRGKENILVSHGRIIWTNMRRHLISTDDLFNAISKATGNRDLTAVKKAYFVTGGKIVVNPDSKEKK